MGVIGVATFKRNLLQGSSNGTMGVLDRGPRGGPESRLWAAVVERAHECANGETRRRSYCTDTTRSSRDLVDGNVVT